MLKSLLLKLLSSVMVEKIKLWIKKAGFTSIAYLLIGLGLLFFGGIIPIVNTIKQELIGASLGIFVYINWNVIVKLWKTKIKTKIDELGDKF
jgi:hypothetical protein